MKEAVSELNLTVIIVILVAALVAFFSMFVWPTVRTGIRNDSDCSNAVCVSCSDDGTCQCHLAKDENKTFVCPNKG